MIVFSVQALRCEEQAAGMVSYRATYYNKMFCYVSTRVQATVFAFRHGKRTQFDRLVSDIETILRFSAPVLYV